MPSSALTGWPSSSVMLCGSAKNARYSSEGASTASSGPGTGCGAYAGSAAGAERPADRDRRAVGELAAHDGVDAEADVQARPAASPAEGDPPAGLLLGGRGLVAPAGCEELRAGRLVEDEAVRESHDGAAADGGD